MIVAINKHDENTFFKIKARFPVEEECLSDFFIFDFSDVDSFSQAVRLAKIRRADILANKTGGTRDRIH